jgi:hypothetical protein
MNFFGSVSVWFYLYVHILDQQCTLVTGTTDLWIGCLFPLSNLEWKYSHYRFQYDNFMWRNLGCFCHHDRCIGGQRNSITCVGTGVSLNPLQIPWVHPTKEKKEKKRKEKYTLLPFSSIWVNIMFKLGTFGLESKSRLMFISSNFQYHFLKPSNSSLLLGLLHLKG